MVNTSQATPGTPQLNAIFQALADPTRRSILWQISARPRTVGELAEPFEMSLAAVSKHLKVLERADLIVREKQGSYQLIGINVAPMKEAHRWLSHYEQFWNQRLDALADVFAEKRKSKETKPKEGKPK